MSDNKAAADAKPKAGGKKKLILIVAIVAVLLIVGGGAAWFMLMRSGGDDEAGGGASRKAGAAPHAPPTFMPIDTMVVNLADPGGDRFAQIGVTLELEDSKTAELVKQSLPSIRSGVLILISQRTADELLTREGKEKLAFEILREVSRPLGFRVPKKMPKAKVKEPNPEDEEESDEDKPARSRKSQNPVRQVLFSNFIIQ